MVTAGLTEILALVSPVLQRYVLAPDAVSVAGEPTLIMDGDADADTLIGALTEIVTLALDEQPFVVPVTE